MISRFQIDPEQNPDCRYCGLGFLVPDGPLCNDEFNRPVFESTNFLVLPSWGHFIPGWLLIIPKSHFPCIGAMSAGLHEEFLAVKARAEAVLKSLYGGVIKFEHGAHSKGCAGSCVDHAHLHLVPVTVDLHDELASHFSWHPCEGVDALTKHYSSSQSYLFYENALGEARIYDVSVLPTQYMRALVAQKVGKLGKHDWRDYMGTAELRQFRTELQTRAAWKLSQ